MCWDELPPGCWCSAAPEACAAPPPRLLRQGFPQPSVAPTRDFLPRDALSGLLPKGTTRLWEAGMRGGARIALEMVPGCRGSGCVCGLGALAAFAQRLPATCWLDVMRGKVQPWSRDLLLFEKQPRPPAFPSLPLVVWAKFFLGPNSSSL